MKARFLGAFVVGVFFIIFYTFFISFVYENSKFFQIAIA